MSDRQQTFPTIDPVRLDKLARVVVHVGLGLKEGQNLWLTSPVEALPLARLVAEHAHKAGVGLVTYMLSDPEMQIARLRHAPSEGLDSSAGWLFEGLAKAFDGGTARLGLLGDDPMMLADEDPIRVARAAKSFMAGYKPALEKISRTETNWNLVAYPCLAWAKRVFPDLSADLAVASLADAIFAACRIDAEDPVAAWNDHNAELLRRQTWLTEHDFASLRFAGPGTDLVVGLADGHAWKGGKSLAGNGIWCNPNIPTEEVFTTPHALRVEGHVAATKPLSARGSLIEEISVRFEGGRIVEAHASKGEDVLLHMLDTDEGSRRLGEVALVPHSSPISKSGVLFFNTLFDENAASHIAIGQSYSKCFREDFPKEEVTRRGGNESLIHVDWMIGSGEVDVDGIRQDGSVVPVFRRGEWA
jgi:aminopeptidase